MEVHPVSRSFRSVCVLTCCGVFLVSMLCSTYSSEVKITDDLANDLISCVEQQKQAAENTPWLCSASLSEMYSFLHASFFPHWNAIYSSHGLPSVVWCALYQMRTPISTFVWDTFVCPQDSGSPVPFLKMPASACQSIAAPPSDVLPLHPNDMYPAGFDAHALGLFLGNLMAEGRESENRIFQLFPEDVCGYDYGPLHQHFNYRGVVYNTYSPRCPHNIAIHTMLATLVKRSPNPVTLNVSRLLRLHLAPHGFGHGLFPRLSLPEAIQVCSKRGFNLNDKVQCTTGVFHSVGNWLRPNTGLEQLDTILPCTTPGDEISIMRFCAANGYEIPSFKQNYTFGEACAFDYYHAFGTFKEWARRCSAPIAHQQADIWQCATTNIRAQNSKADAATFVP